MKKKLPDMYVNEILKNAGNNKSVFSSLERSSMDLTDVRNTIKEIFSSSSYVYKADVEIKVDGNVMVKKIVGKNGDYLLTIDNELIPISKIESIKKLP